MQMEGTQRRLGFAAKVLGRDDLPSHDTRRWQSEPSLAVSIDALHGILEYLDDVGIRMYRMSSDFVPYATHPDMPQFHGQIEKHATGLARLGRAVNRLDIRVSLHPAQFVVLNSESEDVAEKAMWDLDVQARLLDALDQGPEAVVVLHVGGVYGDKAAARERFARNFEALSEPARRRLVVENDETSYTVEDCCWIHDRTGAPVVFDHQHHRLNPGGLDTVDAARRALGTWPSGVVPKIHFSSARLDGRHSKKGGKRMKPPLLRQHADYVDPWTFSAFLSSLRSEVFDVMIEAKAKDLAVLKLQEDLETLGCAAVLHDPRETARVSPRR